MIPFRERNPVPIGATGLLALGLALLLAFNMDAIPFLGGGDRYSAAFSEAGGLQAGDDVRVAGVKVGEVDAVELDTGHVRVDFRVDQPAAFGETTGASIRIQTILGKKFLSLEPDGDGQLEPGSEIPLDRTVSVYDVISAFSDLTEVNEGIDTDQLATSLDTLATEFRNTPEEVQGSLEGLSRLSETIASRDDELGQLLESTRQVSQVLADRDAELERLINDANLLLDELEKRKDDISRLLDATVALSDQVSGLVEDNRAELKPTLDKLNAVLTLLEDNKADIEKGLELMAPFTRVFANTLGSGRWFDTYISNLLVPVGAPTLAGVTP